MEDNKVIGSLFSGAGRKIRWIIFGLAIFVLWLVLWEILGYKAEWDSFIQSMGILVFTGGLLWVALKTYKIEKSSYIGKPKLDIRIEVEEGKYPYLIFENKGNVAVIADIEVYLEPEDKMYESKWFFKQNEFPSREKLLERLSKKEPIQKWKLWLKPSDVRRYDYLVTGYPEVLQKMNYHQYVKHQLVFKGTYRPEIRGSDFRGELLEAYRVLRFIGKNDWLVLRQDTQMKQYLNHLKKRGNVGSLLSTKEEQEYFNTFASSH